MDSLFKASHGGESDGKMNRAFVLLLSCPDQTGVVARVAAFIHEHSGNIYSANQHYDREAQQFFARFAWVEPFSSSAASVDLQRLELLKQDFQTLGDDLSMSWQMHLAGQRLRTAVFVSRYDHCLYDLLVHRDELCSHFCCIVSNHRKLEFVAQHFKLPFFYYDFTGLGKQEAEQQQLELLEREQVELVILARYMQILSPAFLSRCKAAAINIHHSFLPAFKGAKPYHQAYERGVKIIGATSHYVSEELDQGPIIAQDVQTVSYRDSIDDLVRKGRGVEKYVLLQAVRAHTERRVLLFQNRTVVFPG